MFTAAAYGNWLVQVLIQLLNLYSLVIFLTALLSWVLLPPTSPVMRFLRFITEPILSPCRQLLSRVLPLSWRRFDFSPILAMLVIEFIAQLLRFFF